ncbi:uncharacterized protein LOC142889207 [Nelusetta ayraudi]|uniref:uncharacterized protein LOC142889207 n=1 Tax=Nelusetta ayraudi TaxID=303726 RepID=UPI003F6E681E
MEKEKKSPVKKTFVCDDSMIITIPLSGVMNVREAQLMPDKFHCIFKDFYKVFAINGRPKPLGAAQAVVGVFIITLGLILMQWQPIISIVCATSSVLFVVSGMLSYAAGHFPNIHMAKFSFSLNIVSFFWSAAAIITGAIILTTRWNVPVHQGVCVLIVVLLFVENFIALFLIYWLSKAVCRTHFNTLPTIILKQAD